MSNQTQFTISTHLKDIIGRDLVTNEYVALFELVKNSFDAGAKKVDLEFDLTNQRIIIADNGDGMSKDDLKNKWLFVAYSDKTKGDSTEYHNRILAGSKGIGRFSCDTLGRNLELYSKKNDEISHLLIDWLKFEENSLNEFQNVNVTLTKTANLPTLHNPTLLEKSGTILVIDSLRNHWDIGKIKKLRKDLAKLIDPFGGRVTTEVSTWIHSENKQDDFSQVNGKIQNDVADILKDKTSRIHILIEGQTIHTILVDRGRTIYEIKEPSPYPELQESKIEGEIYYLNRSAKINFKNNTGITSIVFGSIFLFLNNFRIFPIGEEFDDTLGLNRRKQQGHSRYLGTRDVMGRIDITAPSGTFREVSSRDAGLIEDARTKTLYNAIQKHMLERLERYVVGVNWKDKLDQQNETAEGLDTDPTRVRILELLGNLSKGKEIDILYYDKDLAQIPEDPDQVTDKTLRAMRDLAAHQGDNTLLNQVERARRRLKELKAEKEEAQQTARENIAALKSANEKILHLEKQNTFLNQQREDMNGDQIELLIHQAIIHLSDLDSALDNENHHNSIIIKNTEEGLQSTDPEDVKDCLAVIQEEANGLQENLASATLSLSKLRSLLSFAPHIKMFLKTHLVDGDVIQYLREYLDLYNTRKIGLKAILIAPDSLTFERTFSPVELSVIIDNLLDNAKKFDAKTIYFTIKSVHKNTLKVHITDDGLGIDLSKVITSKIFERGYSHSPNGTGLGLYIARKLIHKIGGNLELISTAKENDAFQRATFELTLLNKQKD